MTAQILAASAAVPSASSEPVPAPLVGPQTAAPAIRPAKVSPLVKSLLGHKWLRILLCDGIWMIHYGALSIGH